jgi:tRNA G10  N-methylase Trm11
MQVGLNSDSNRRATTPISETLDESFTDVPNTDPYKEFQATLGGSDTAEMDLNNVDWGFGGANTKYLTHGLMRYPARMVPQIPRTLLSYWKETGTISEGDTVFDPFSGSGTTAAEARLHGLNAIATDINPFACTLSRGKATNVNLDELKGLANRCVDKEWRSRERIIEENHEEEKSRENHTTKFGSDIYKKNGNRPDPNNRPTYVKKGWFPEPQIYKIESMSRLLSELRREYSHKATRIARLSLAETAREMSYQRNREFKRHRIPEADRANHDPPFTNTFIETLYENVKRVEAYQQHASPGSTVEVIHGDCRSSKNTSKDSVEAAILSPPYGDHSTTVGYGQFSQNPASTAMPIPETIMKDVDPSGLGGRNSESQVTMEQVMNWSPTLEETVSKIKQKDGRDDDILEFFTDYSETLLTIADVVKSSQPIAIVVGNRTVSRVPVPLNLITTELALEFGLKHNHSFPREIPSKTLPLKNAPENIPGQSGNLIADENILLFRAP